ncbi:D-tyrosyl-tRNA(Tyr) deacylase [Leucobacter sp. cx-42]|uniref:D-aminoacyl-tRNA deacylase n=1 Tax=unclassified Leucobacter TaxID=2621730 RepID=UPI00165DBD14|nr:MULTISPECIES: D-aminoacyl-tRNA deacylase [unclassified Leucobacter]MBC9953039.1 D-tyrosyl-tRNA(Tyr) deacylase [Leucobacter sp. cx-42]
MKLVVQRASRASVTVEEAVVGSFDEQGLVVLVGATHEDTPEIAARLADKVWNLRVLDDEQSCAMRNAPILVVSQFTLYGDVRKGTRPSWSKAAPGAVAEPLVDAFATALRAQGATVNTGQFGAYMQVELVNDGPITLVIDSDMWSEPRR